MTAARVVVTGLGVVAPNGPGIEQFWEATLKGISGITPIDRFDPSGAPSALAGQVLEFDATAHLPRKLLPQTDVSTRFSLAATGMALADAGLELPVAGEDAAYRTGVITANARGGFEFTHREFRKLWTEGPGAVSVYESFAWFYAVNTGQVSIRHGLQGPGRAFVAEQAAGVDVFGHARRTVRDGTPVVVTGGVDSALDPWGWAAHHASGRISRSADPATCYLPFDARADGHVPGEGGAMLILEDAAQAGLRGARVLGEIAGHAATFEPAPSTGRPPTLGRAAALALDEAGIGPADVDVVFADASGVPAEDDAESAAIRAMFGPYGVPVSAPKALCGRLGAGGGPLDVVTALLSVRDGVVPPTTPGLVPDPRHGLDLVVDEPRYLPVRTCLVLARGRWGFNSALVVRAAAPATQPKGNTQ